MTKLVAVLPWVLMTTACVPAGYLRQPMLRPYGGAGATSGPAARYPVAAPPIGRWDNVMMLAVGTSVQVLLLDGGLANGRVVAADSRSLRLRVASGELDVAAADVMRVDRVETKGSAVAHGTRGAAFGAGVVGVLGLAVGRVPPPRVFAAGAIAGAYQNVELGGLTQGPATIYLSPAVAPIPSAAPQWTPRGVPR